MNRLLFNIYRVIVPKPLRTFILKKNLRKKLIRHLSSSKALSGEEQEVLDYLRVNPLSIFPYSFSDKYSADNVEVFFDHSRNLRYVIQEGKRLYFKRRWGVSRIRRAYADLSREQDPESPHRYLSGTFNLAGNDVVADIGAAEGNFSLSVIEKVGGIILIESDREWIEALRATFEPWKEKIIIVEKYLSDSDNDNNLSLDFLYRSHPEITFFKIDVDGYEEKVLKGASETLASGCSLKIALCTYHRHKDEVLFTRILENNGFNVAPSNGYMIHYYDKKLRSPWLRRGLLRASR